MPSLLVLLVPSATHAATLQVGPTRTYTTIQSAVDAASSGDTIEIDPGSYNERVDVESLDLSLVGTGGSGATSLTSSEPVTLVLSYGTVTVTGLTVENGTTGISIGGGADVTLDDIVVSGHDSTSTGAGLSISDSTLLVTDGTFEDNVAFGADGGHVNVSLSDVTFVDTTFQDGNANFGGAVMFSDASTARFERCDFLSNTADSEAGAIGAAGGPAITIVDTTFDQNLAGSGGGGAILAIDPGTTLDLSNVDFSLNEAAGGAAAIYAVNAAVTSDGSSFADHTVNANGAAILIAGVGTYVGTNDSFDTNRASGGYGGAIRAEDSSTVSITGADFTGNQALRGGAISSASSGGVTVTGATFDTNQVSEYGGAVHSDGTGPLRLYASTFVANRAVGSGSQGGAVWVYDGVVTLTDVSFTRNQADHAGAVGAQGDVVTITRGTFCANQVTGAGGALGLDGTTTAQVTASVFAENTAGSGGAVYVRDVGTATFENDTFAGNSSTGDGGSLYFDGSSATFENNVVTVTGSGNGISADSSASGRTWSFEYNDFYDNLTDDFGTTMGFLTLSATNIASDPLFTSWSVDANCGNDAFWPQTGSPLVDAGDPADTDPDGTRADIGAYGGLDADPDVFADGDGDGWIWMWDCDDASDTRNPDASETCNSLDDDCDGTVDEDAIDPATWYVDSDGDGYGSTSATTTACDEPAGYSATDDDCDDADEDVHPGATETCADTTDVNCDGSIGTDDADRDGVIACEDCDDTDAAVGAATTWYRDSDGDGHGLASTAFDACSPPSSYVSVGDDCNDADGTVYPGAPETCTDTVDKNCDGSVGSADVDADGVIACDDCDDSDASVYPTAPEICDDQDNDCDAEVDEAGDLYGDTWYTDADQDGFGDPDTAVTACDAPSGTVDDSSDCDDADPDAHPGAPEVAGDGIDQDCDGLDLADERQDTGEEEDEKCGCATPAGAPVPIAWLALVLAATRLRSKAR